MFGPGEFWVKWIIVSGIRENIHIERMKYLFAHGVDTVSEHVDSNLEVILFNLQSKKRLVNGISISLYIALTDNNIGTGP